MPKLFFPLPMTYAVIQLDVAGSLQGLDPDSQAVEAARALKPLKCLVYLHTVLELPFPRNPDFKYEVYIVGPGLRPANEARCIPEDMCAPIFPATEHPSGRAPVRPKPSFPFSNCYHWFGADTHLDVRVKQKIYDAKEGEVHVELSGVEQVYMDDCYQDDSYRVRDMLAQRAAKEQPTASDMPQEHPQPEHQYVRDPAHDVDLEDCGASISGFTDYSCEGPVPPELSAHLTSEDDLDIALTSIDVFGMDRNSERAMIPVVDCWLDLPAHVDHDAIPDPFAFIQECRALSEIVKELQVRQAGAGKPGQPSVASGEAVAESRDVTVLERLKGVPAAVMKTIRSVFRVQ